MNEKASSMLHEITSNFIQHPVSMDESHAMLIYSIILAYKPHRILEMGIGQGATSRLILAAIAANQRGHLIACDNWCDWNGQRPVIADYLLDRGADIVQADQTAFLKLQGDSSFGVVISDANHDAEPDLILEFLRITEKGGFIFVHDANNERFRESLIKNTSYFPYHIFSVSSVPGERCERGLLMIQKR